MGSIGRGGWGVRTWCWEFGIVRGNVGRHNSSKAYLCTCTLDSSHVHREGLIHPTSSNFQRHFLQQHFASGSCI